MSDMILHHYPTSPFSEKVRVAFGIKGLGWKSVIIPRILPKPDLMPLTGGYRKTPVLQIDADIYCDTQLILREIERRAPEPTLNFAAHLANWELPAVGVASLGARTAVPYRRPNIRAIDDVIIKLRAPLMGELIATGLYAPVKLGRLSKMRSSRCAMPTVRSTSGAPCR
jgi:glutathione S-transferase